jgi:hypothetical protein
VLLTNDKSYWVAGKYEGTCDAAFRLDEGRRLEGTLSWTSHAGKGTVKGREAAIPLPGSYECQWHDYVRIAGHDFRYLLISVRG